MYLESVVVRATADSSFYRSFIIGNRVFIWLINIDNIRIFISLIGKRKVVL